MARRPVAAKGLGRSKDSRAAQPAVTALQDKEKSVRASAMEGLCGNRAAWATGPIIAALKDPNSSFETQCLNSSTGAPGWQITVSFLELLHDPDDRTRGLASEALSHLVAEHGVLGVSLDLTDTRVIDAFLGALRAKDMAVISRADTFTFLVALGAPGSEDALIEALNQRGEHWTASYLLTCGDAKLEEAARAWLTQHNACNQMAAFGVPRGAAIGNYCSTPRRDKLGRLGGRESMDD